MAVEVLVPQMGESVLEGTILEWKVKVGDRVKLNQPLVELMTDKINIEIPAETDGVLIEQSVAEGEVIAVGARIAIIDDGSGDTVVSAPAAATAPATQSVAAASSSSSSAPVAVAPPPPKIASTAPTGKGKMSPKVRMMLRNYSLDPSTVTPTGSEGIVTIEDVLRTVEGRSASAGYSMGPIPTPPLPTMPTLPSVSKTADVTEIEPPRAAAVRVEIPTFQPLPSDQRETRQPVEGIRKLISDHMMKSISTSAHVTTFEDIDLTNLAEYRKKIKPWFVETYGANITFMPFIAKAVCLALKEFPKLNATMTDSEITYKNYYNVGIAVAREDGLIVPVIKDADKKTIVELAWEIAQLGEKARTNRLLPDDVSGGTFSLTNAGMFGATASTPIINQPQVAILGIHAIVKKPWVVDGEIVVRDMSTFGLSFDHRLIDGHIAVQFLHRVHEYLSDLNKLLLYLR